MSASDAALEPAWVSARVVPWRELLLSGGAAAVLGLGLWMLWWRAGFPAGVLVRGLAGHGPDPAAWPRLLALWIPTAHVLFTLAHAWLGRWPAGIPARRYALADHATLGLVPVLAGALLAVGPDGPWRALIGAWYVTFLALKTGLFLRALWSGLDARAASTQRLAVAVFLAGLLPYGVLGGYVTTAVSTSGDEPYYLLNAHSLVRDGDLDLANNLAAREYLSFYWSSLAAPADREPDGAVHSRAHQGLQPLLLLPGYAVAGRGGAVALMGLLSAATLALVFLLALETGVGPRAAFLAWLAVAFSVPVLSYSTSLFPEMSGAFFATLGVYVVSRDRRVWLGRAALAPCVAALLTLKSRFVLLALPLLLGAARRLTWRAVAALGLTLALAVASAVAYDAAVFHGQIREAGLRNLLWWTFRGPLSSRGHLGLLVDQEHGILVAAPVLLLALAGAVVAGAERRWRALLLVAGPFLLSWYYLAAVSWGWHGGFNPPARLVVGGLPLLGVLVALALARLRGRLPWGLTVALYALTLAYAAILSAWPELRYQHAIGRAALLHWVFARWGLDVGRVLPSYIGPESPWIGPLVVLALALGAGWLLARRRGASPPRGAVMLGLLIALGVGVGVTAWVWHRPAGTYPAVLGQGLGGSVFHGFVVARYAGNTVGRRGPVWAAQRDGVLELAPRLPAGRYHLRLRVGSQGEAGGPALALFVGPTLAYRVGLPPAPPPQWREAEYGHALDWGGGRLPLRVELTQVSRDGLTRLAYVASVEVRRLAR